MDRERADSLEAIPVWIFLDSKGVPYQMETSEGDGMAFCMNESIAKVVKRDNDIDYTKTNMLLLNYHISRTRPTAVVRVDAFKDDTRVVTFVEWK